MHKILDLFSGIGGFSLGLERTNGFKTIGFCEIDPFCQKVLKKHWPHVPIHEDIREVSGNEYKDVEVITGGFPCQDVSVGHTWRKAEGIKGERSGLWSEIVRLANEIRPKWVICENVAALRTRGLTQCLQDLWSIGYDAEWHVISASSVGACHQRERLWIIAYPQSKRVERLWAEGEQITRPLDEEFLFIRNSHGEWKVEPDIRRINDGVPGRVDRLRAIGNAVVPTVVEVIGRKILEKDI